ncbi:uncharacterized protein LOC128983539 [Macrosteles quadrilineatus]|uniref:uncharacterized protein LOC128983539 n=1 Tax=Macrosteles quadrilineatus TaxID=74068 RepID=UPI0023E26140|nr:uncharacterized protein LOC128983539 [Macrosteles quadrilineatus]
MSSPPLTLTLLLLNTILLVGMSISLAEGKSPASKHLPCPIEPYTDVDLNKVGGTWYAVRGIEHESIKQTSRQRNNNACPVITLKLVDTRHIDFSYDSKNGSEPKHYNMTVKDPAHPSVWTTEKGTKKHVPFAKLQVNDMTENSLALTMCGTQRLASVILSREKRFDGDIVEAVTKRLAGKGLNTTRSFDRCKT